MQHVTKAAAATVTDRGEFTAIAAAWTVDRQNERIAPGAFSDTIQRWSSSGKEVPIHWNHEGSADSIIGSVDPATMKETEQGLYVEGQLDLEDSEMAREVWRSVKRGRVSLSFGFVTKSAHDEGDVHVLDSIDLFEVSIVAAPANADTRILSAKSIGADVRADTQAWMERILADVGPAEDLREKSLRLAKQAAPPKTASFPVE